MAEAKVDIPFPVKGYTENAPYRTTPEGFTTRALNVVVFDVIEERLRLGKRPGTARAVGAPVDADGTPVMALGQITLASDQFVDPAGFFTDPDWATPGWGWQFPNLDWPDFEFPIPDDPGTPIAPPSPPPGLGAEVEGSTVTLTWE